MEFLLAAATLLATAANAGQFTDTIYNTVSDGEGGRGGWATFRVAGAPADNGWYTQAELAQYCIDNAQYEGTYAIEYGADNFYGFLAAGFLGTYADAAGTKPIWKCDGGLVNGIVLNGIGYDSRITTIEGQNLDARATTLEGKATTLEGQVATLEGQTLDTRVTAIEGHGLDARATTLEGQVATLEGQTLDTRVTAMEDFGLDARATTLEGKTTTLEGQVATLEGQTLNSRATTLELQVGSLETDVAALTSEVASQTSVDARVATLETEVSALAAQVEELLNPSLTAEENGEQCTYSDEFGTHTGEYCAELHECITYDCRIHKVDYIGCKCSTELTEEAKKDESNRVFGVAAGAAAIGGLVVAVAVMAAYRCCRGASRVQLATGMP